MLHRPTLFLYFGTSLRTEYLHSPRAPNIEAEWPGAGLFVTPSGQRGFRGAVRWASSACVPDIGGAHIIARTEITIVPEIAAFSMDIGFL